MVKRSELLTLVEKELGIAEVRELTNVSWRFKPDVSSTFHGRDIFSPAGAHLAKGDAFEQAGPVLSSWVHLEIPEAKRDGVDRAAVGRERDVQAMPVHGGRLGQFVAEVHDDPIALPRFEGRAWYVPVIGVEVGSGPGDE